MANFKVGDEVVCVDAILREPIKWTDFIRRGEKYRVQELNETCVGLREAPYPYADHPDAPPCDRCKNMTRYIHYRHYRFIKLDGLNEPENESVGTNLPALVERT